MTRTIEQAMTDVLLSLGNVDVLVYASVEQTWARQSPCKLTTFTPVRWAHGHSASEYHEFVRTNLHHRAIKFEEYCSTTATRFGLIFLEEGQSIDWYIKLINISRRCSLGNALFAVLGANLSSSSLSGKLLVDPLNRRSSAPSDDERCLMSLVLRQSGAEVTSWPTHKGCLILATNVGHLNPAHASLTCDYFKPQMESGQRSDRLNIESPASDAEEILARVSTSQRAERYVRVVLDPNETGVLINEIDTFQDWIRPPPAFVADFSANGTDTTKLLNTSRSMHGVSVDEFFDVDLIGRDLILASAGVDCPRAVYGKNRQPAAMHGSLQTVADEVEWDAATRVLRGSDGNFYYPRCELTNSCRMEEGLFHLTPDEHFNFGMWLFYSVPGVRHYKKLRDRYPKAIASLILPWQRAMLLDLGVAEGDLIQQGPTTVYRCNRLATMRQTYRSFSFPQSDRDAFDEVAGRAVSLIPGKTPEKIFVSRLSRTKAGGHRGLLNEAELAGAMEGLGYTTVEPEKLSLLEQARLFHQAKSIVGLGGAAMFNTAFCKPGIGLIDIESSVYFMDAHSNIFASRGLNYGLILGSPDLGDPDEHQKRWSIDVQRTVDVIKRFVG